MPKIIDLQNKMPHVSGPAVCVACGHEWTAVAPSGRFDELECGNCGLMKGVLKYGVVPEPTWVCGCGCWLFTISGKTGNIMCWQCGREQRGFE